MTEEVAGTAGKRAAGSMSAVQVAQSGLMVALMAVAAQVSIYIGPVPFTLQIVVVVLTALLFEPRQAAFTLLAYALIGAVGVPVFSGMRGGLGVIAGPTGGYIYGYIPAVLLASLARRAVCPPATRPSSPVRSVVADAIAALIVIAVCYTTGTLHFMAVGALADTPHALAYVVGVCVAPFVVPDIIKSVAAILVATALRKAVPSIRAC